jgi:hypothetical protein
MFFGIVLFQIEDATASFVNEKLSDLIDLDLN